ncbi:MAG: hypothetical protein QXW47_08610 [Candidatus Jordarchaeales archaeon]
MSSGVEVRFQVQCRGVMLLKFDYVVGPLVEKIFPKGIINEELLWNIALDMWMTMGSKSMEKGYSTIVFLRDFGMFACLVSGGYDEAPYAMAALFDPEGVSGFWSIKEEVISVLLDHIERVKRGEDAEKVVREAYDTIVKTTLGLTRAEASSSFLHETVDFITRLVSHVQKAGKLGGELKALLKNYVERLADEASRAGADEVLKGILKLKLILET